MQKITVERQIFVGTGAEVADALGLEPRRFQQLVKQGYIEGKLAHNEYDLAHCLATYRSFITERR